jgi:hypothetical protein
VSATSLTRKEEIWLACARKDCCYAPVVVPTGRDIWQIARSLETPPWSFVRYFATPTLRPDAIRLDRTERLYRLVLAKGPTRRTKRPAPCIFLLRTRRGDHRCGLGSLRPAACQAFLADSVGGVVRVANDAGCSCRQWSLADVDLVEEAAAVKRRQQEAREYHAIVAEWNEGVRQSAPDQSVDFLAYCDFLLDRYDRIAASVAETGTAS